CDAPASSIDTALHFDQRTSRGWTLGPAAGTARFGLARRSALAGAGQFFRFWRDRSLDKFEPDFFRTGLHGCLIKDQHDANVAATLQLTEQHLVSQAFLDVLLDHARHRPRTHLLVIAVLHQPSLGRIR